MKSSDTGDDGEIRKMTNESHIPTVVIVLFVLGEASIFLPPGERP
jgi:hypothetical protein